MRILIFSLSYFPKSGGAEVAIREITSRIPNKEIQFDLVTLRFDKSHPKSERMGQVNIYRIGGGLGYLSKILFVPQAVLFALFKKHDLYWAMMTNMLFPIVILRFLGKRTPYVLTLQDGDPYEHVFERKRISIFKPLLKYGFRRANKITAISTFLAGWAKQIGYRGDVEIIPNGVDVNLFMKDFSEDELEKTKKRIGKNDGDVILASSSRLVRKNGLDDVIRALPLLSKNIKFFNWGVGPDKQKLEILARSLNVSDRVRLLPHVSDELPKNFKVSDIFIRPSRSEGQGISFIEGMAAGIPIIGTPVGGITDFLKDGETGLFGKVDDPQSIADVTMKLIEGKELRERIVTNAKKMVKEKYDWDLIAEQMRSKVFRPL